MTQNLKGLFNKNEVKQRIHDMRQKGMVLPDYDLAVNGLIGQTDKSGDAYSHHMINVSRHNTDSEAKMIIGILHDLIEDSDWELEDLAEIGFSQRILNGIDGVTHREGEKYFDSIERCSFIPDSIDVKLKDNRHNLDGSRNNWLPSEKDRERQAKYLVTRHYLIDVKKGAIAPGTPVFEWMKTQEPKMQDFDLVRKYSSYKQSAPKTTPPTPQV